MAPLLPVLPPPPPGSGTSAAAAAWRVHGWTAAVRGDPNPALVFAPGALADALVTRAVSPCPRTPASG